MKAIVLAGGTGECMRPLTEGFPKPLLRIAGLPLIEYVIRGLDEIKVSEYVVVVSDKRVAEYVEERLGSRVEIISQKRKEIEGALVDSLEYIGTEDRFILAYSDIIAPPEMYRYLIETYSTSGATAVLTVVPIVNTETYGVAKVDFTSGKVIDIVEKPSPPLSPSTLALGGAYILPHRVALYVKDGLSLPEALSREIEAGRVVPFMWNGDWIDVGYPWDILSANYVVLNWLKISRISTKAEIASTAIVEGPVIIEDGAEIDHYAVVKGPAYIGPSTFIGKSAFVREYSSIEEGSVIGAFSEVKRSSLQPHASTGSYVLLIDSVLGPNAVVEPRVTVMSRIEKDLHIVRQLPLQGIVKKYRKLGIFVAPNSRIKASITLGPGVFIHLDGTISNIVSTT